MAPYATLLIVKLALIAHRIRTTIIHVLLTEATVVNVMTISLDSQIFVWLKSLWLPMLLVGMNLSHKNPLIVYVKEFRHKLVIIVKVMY